jgi:NAD(P)-dependent dehydrogenase (short-subunit alcohol dehydrogenase family)
VGAALPGGVYVPSRNVCARHRRLTGYRQGIAIKLAEKGARVAIHYYQNEIAARATLAKVRECGCDGFLVQADVCHPEEVMRIFARVKSEFGELGIFVHNARPEAEFSRLPTLPGDDSEAGNPGSRWAQRKRRWSRYAAISQWLLQSDVSP